jgi:hypothetical protein
VARRHTAQAIFLLIEVDIAPDCPHGGSNFDLQHAFHQTGGSFFEPQLTSVLTSERA